MKTCTPADLGLQAFIYRTGVGEHKAVYEVHVPFSLYQAKPIADDYFHDISILLSFLKTKGSASIGESPFTLPVGAAAYDDLCISAVFLDALVGLIDPARCHFNKRCISVAESPSNPRRTLLTFLDGTTHEADVVLGADGIKSTIRKYILDGEPGNRVAFSNTVAYRGLIPYDKLKAAGFKTDLSFNPTCFVGPSKVSAHLPAGHEVKF